MSILMKNISTLFFIAFLMIVALAIPTSALLNNPIFHDDNVRSFHFDNSKIFRSEGFILSNIGGQDVMLAQDELQITSLYDLYLGFEEEDFTNNYITIKNAFETNFLQRRKGKHSAKFISSGSSIMLFPTDESILKKNVSGTQNFTISFQLFPYRIGEGTQRVVAYEGYFTDPLLGIQTVGFSITIENGLINYHFDNFFMDGEGTLYSFTLKEKTPVVDVKWEMHTVVVDSANSTIRVYRNNEEQDIAFIRQGKKFNGSQLYLSDKFKEIQNVPLTIGQNGVFSLDEFYIYKEAITNFMEHTPNKKLFFETEVFCVSKNISYLYEMKVSASSLKENYRLAYRFSDRFFLPNNTTIPWVYVDTTKKNFPPSYKTGKYLQWRVEYFTPTQDTDEIFYIDGILANYKETTNPGIVKINSIIAKDGSIDISWKTLPSDLIESYEIYYGYAPNNYFGKAEFSPASPVSINIEKSSVSQDIHYTLDGLDNERPYYISIRAKDVYGQYGSFSPEIVTRPSSVNNDFGYSIGR